ncbi:MAG: aromatic amino acid lyase [Gammaproteobacteria bacterium]|nr:MAG: aromatic amino acid lyase [Gammaproteobacteria bacterium]
MCAYPRLRHSLALGALTLIGTGGVSLPALAAGAYTPITPTMAERTITLTGHDLTIEQIVQVARYGAKVQLSPEARQRQADNYGLLLEAAAEGVAVYWFNRGAGDQRETVMFEGDATSPANKPKVAQMQMWSFRRGAVWGFGPEVEDEDIVRAMMVVRANAMTFNAPSPQLAQMLLDLLNKRITPVVQSRGTLGEGDLAQLSNVGGAMVGAGEVYYQGVRMPAAKALAQAGLKPIEPFAADDNALTSSDAYATGQAALVVNDARRALEWADLIYAMDLNGMNSSITPLSLVVQCDRPGLWLNWDAARVLDMIKGSYLFDADPTRIIQDPESLRASSIRQAAAWQEWSALNEAVLFQANSSDHNPAVHVGLGPQDSWELASAQMLRFYVKGGPLSHGQHGYIVSNANWDPYPMANKLENFVIALANMDVAVMLRIDRFSSPFFTVVKASDVLPGGPRWIGGYTPVALQQEIQSLTNPVAPFGSAIVGTVEDLQAQTLIKVQHARQAVATTMDLLAHDLLGASLWIDVRKAQNASREFGQAPLAAWTAFRKAVPLGPGPFASTAVASEEMLAAAFVHGTDPAAFYSGAPPPSGTGKTAPAAARCSP